MRRRRPRSKRARSLAGGLPSGCQEKRGCRKRPGPSEVHRLPGPALHRQPQPQEPRGVAQGMFAGGFGLDAAEAVCGSGGLDVLDVADLLGSLVDKSLVVAEPAGEPCGTGCWRRSGCSPPSGSSRPATTARPPQSRRRTARIPVGGRAGGRLPDRSGEGPRPGSPESGTGLTATAVELESRH
jgi:hypothetical protein